jgi:uncharacterized protein (DUF433 family)
MGITIEPLAPPLRVDEDGVVRVGQTRVTLDVLVYEFLDGATADQIADNYPSIGLGEAHAAIAYYLEHRTELDGYLQQRRREAEDLGARIDAHPSSRALRERLLARKAEQDAQKGR